MSRGRETKQQQPGNLEREEELCKREATERQNNNGEWSEREETEKDKVAAIEWGGGAMATVMCTVCTGCPRH